MMLLETPPDRLRRDKIAEITMISLTKERMEPRSQTLPRSF
jgi:hypothetical protein